MKHAWISGFCVIFLSACAFESPTIEQPAAEESPATEIKTEEAEVALSAAVVDKPAPPSEISSQSEALFASATFPSNLWQLAPELDAKLRADAEADFQQMEADARRYMEEDPDYFRQYGLGIDWELLAAAGDLISLHGFYYYNTGGAHPNYLLSGLLYDTANLAELHVLDLFAEPELARQHLLELVRVDLIAQKRERLAENGVDAADIATEIRDLISEQSQALNGAALVSSSQADKFGGIVVYFSPYDIGPYAEGAYIVKLPQAAFREGLKVDYADLFEGEMVVPEDQD